MEFQIQLLYAAVRFSMVVSDTTGNVKKCRAFICDAWPWILNCPDPWHQLNLLAKEIMLGSKKHPKIAGFADFAPAPTCMTSHWAFAPIPTCFLTGGGKAHPQHPIRALGRH
jgi:hypothetical protein